MRAKRRLDIMLADSGLVPSRQTAQALIMAGQVLVDGKVVDKPGTRIEEGAALTLAANPRPFASRGGIKLSGALDALGLDVSGRIAIDLGASTGGFTDCLLQRGALRVAAVDVGHGQLDWTLRQDPRVVAVEGVNARSVTRAALPGFEEGAGIVTLDLSFISLELVLPAVPGLLREAAPRDVVALVKPQFEVGRGGVGRGGIVRDPRLKARAIAKVAACAVRLGLSVRGLTASCLPGAEGNLEYFIHASPEGPGLTPEEIEDHAQAIAGA